MLTARHDRSAVLNVEATVAPNICAGEQVYEWTTDQGVKMRFEVKVSGYGGRWLISAPAFGVRKIVDDESAIQKEAYRMIARCGTAPAVFEIELVPGADTDPSPPVTDRLGPVETDGHGPTYRSASISDIRAGTRRIDEPLVDDGF